MSANTLTGLIDTLYKAADTVAREQAGFIPAVYMDGDVENVAKDQVITYPIVPTMSATDITPSATLPDPSGITVGTGTMTISKERAVRFPWNGNEQASMRRVYQQTLEYQFVQAMRTLVNEIDSDLFLAAKRGASRAYGTAGTTPFGTAGNFADFAEIVQILDDNGTPDEDRHMVLSGAAKTKILSVQSSLFKANEAGGSEMLRDAKLGRVEGLDLHHSKQIVSHTKGTGTGYLVDLTAGYAVNSTTIHLDTGTGTLLAGDVLTNTKTARDTNKYIIGTGFAGDGDGDIVLNKPGNQVAWVNNDPVAIGNSYTGSFAFHRYALHLLCRLPMMPDGGDAADDVYEFIDPFSGLPFQIAIYKQYRQVVYEVGIAWGVKAVKSEFIATLLG